MELVSGNGHSGFLFSYRLGQKFICGKECGNSPGRRRKNMARGGALLVMAASIAVDRSHKQRGMVNALSGVNSAVAISGVWQGGRL